MGASGKQHILTLEGNIVEIDSLAPGDVLPSAGVSPLAAVLTEGNETGEALPIVVTGTDQSTSTITAVKGAQQSAAYLTVGVEPGDGSGGQVALNAGGGVTGFSGGNANLVGGGGNGTGGPQATGGDVFAGGGKGDGTPGSVELYAGGVGTGTGKQGGDILLVPSGGDGAGRTGLVIIYPFGGLPTSDPAVAGALWSNAGVVHVSAG